MAFEPCIRCVYKECHARGGSIRLPYPNPPETKTGLAEWPTDDWRAWIVILSCGHMFAYTKQHVRWEKFPPLDPYRGRAFWYRIGFRCGAKGSAVRIELNVESPAGTTVQELIGLISAKAISGEKLRCGHYLTLKQMPNIRVERLRGRIRAYHP